MKKIVNMILVMCCMGFLFGCQKKETLQVSCGEKEVKFIEQSQDDKLDFSSLIDSHLSVKHGEKVHINIANKDVKVTEVLLNEDGSQHYTKGFGIHLLDEKEVTFEIKSSLLDQLSSVKVNPDDSSLRGYVVEYDDKVIMFVLETNVGDFGKEFEDGLFDDEIKDIKDKQ